jgi:ubiquinone/menaquinone biosynthesis C-methylase UbiE
VSSRAGLHRQTGDRLTIVVPRTRHKIMTITKLASRVRTRVAILLKAQRWMLPALTIVCGIALAVSVVQRAQSPLVFASAVCLMLVSYLWGFATRAFRPARWPSTTHLRRRQYAQVWNTIASSPRAAGMAAAGKDNEDELRRSAAPTIGNLAELIGIGIKDDVLEIGCGVARIGRELAARRRTWTGADISENMLSHASARLTQISNVRLQCLQGEGLKEFADRMFDVVYCTNMLSHLDEFDRWRYIREAYRVLRPQGRVFVDTIDFESDRGWAMFVVEPLPDLDSERPPYSPRFSTASELETYAKRAGFEQVITHKKPPLVILTAVKPTGARAA